MDWENSHPTWETFLIFLEALVYIEGHSKEMPTSASREKFLKVWKEKAQAGKKGCFSRAGIVPGDMCGGGTIWTVAQHVSRLYPDYIKNL